LHPVGDQSSNDEHRDGTTNGSEEQKLTSTPFVDENGQPKDRDHCFDHAEETRGKIDCILACYAHCEILVSTPIREEDFDFSSC